MSSPLPLDPYEILGVSKDAPLSAIRTAHRKLVLKCHPDKIKDEAQRDEGQNLFQKVQEAYELLSDETKRTRYDQKVLLAELRKEALERDWNEPPYARPKPSSGASYEYTADRIYEERVPASARFFDDEDDVRFTDEPRSTSRKYNSYEKRSTTKDADEKKKYKYADVKVDPIYITKERPRETRETREPRYSKKSEKVKSRDKERKREMHEKYSTRSAPYIEVVSEDSSDSEEPVYVRKQSSRRSYEEKPRRSKTESSRKESRRGREDDFSDEWDSKYDPRLLNAQEYIERSKGNPPIEVDRRPRTSRSPSYYYDSRDSDSPRRSSGRRTHSTRDAGRGASEKDRRSSVDDIPLKGYETRKVPSMPTATSAPSGIKIPGLKPPSQPQRSSTTSHVREKREPPSIRRSETSPLVGASSRRPEPVTSRSSKLKGAEIYDSGYSSPGTPEMHQGTSPPKSSTKYAIVDEEAEYATRPRIIAVDPSSYRRHKSVSPVRVPKEPARPSPKSRGSTATYVYPADSLPSRHSSSRPEPVRSSSSRNSPPLRGSSGRDRDRLYGEVVEESYPRFEERYASRSRPEDPTVRYNVRKGTVDSYATRDPYPRSSHPEQHRQPGIGKREYFVH